LIRPEHVEDAGTAEEAAAAAPLDFELPPIFFSFRCFGLELDGFIAAILLPPFAFRRLPYGLHLPAAAPSSSLLPGSLALDHNKQRPGGMRQ
jgi:hypothetical protein